MYVFYNSADSAAGGGEGGGLSLAEDYGREPENSLEGNGGEYMYMYIPYSGKIWRALIMANHSPKHIGEF